MKKNLFKKVTLGLLVLAMMLSIIPTEVAEAAAKKDWQYFRFKGKMKVNDGFDPRNYVDVKDAEKMCHGSIKKVNSSTYDITVYDNIDYYLQCKPTCNWIEEYVDGLWQWDKEVRNPGDGWYGIEKDKYYIVTSYDYDDNINVDVWGADNGQLVINGWLPKGKSESKTVMRVWIAKNGKRVSSKLTFNVTVKSKTGGKTIFEDLEARVVEACAKETSELKKLAVLTGYLGSYFEYDDPVWLSTQSWSTVTSEDIDVLKFSCIREYPSLRYGVCGDLAEWTEDLAELVGIRCEYAPLYSARHAGNLVVIDGKTYYLDLIQHGFQLFGSEDDMNFKKAVLEYAPSIIESSGLPELAEHGIDFGERKYSKIWDAHEDLQDAYYNYSRDAYDSENKCYRGDWIYDKRLGDVRKPNAYLDKKLQEYLEEYGDYY